MTENSLPLIIEPSAVKQLISGENPSLSYVIIDLSQADSYIQQHIPGAVYLDYNWIVHMDKPRMGLLPTTEQLSRVVSAYGIAQDTHVIAYDDEGGGRASRFLWTLQCIDHPAISLVNGGLQAWLAEQWPTDQIIHFPTPLQSQRRVSLNEAYIADKHYISAHLDDLNTVILDARSTPEYSGAKAFAMRGGHIPGAVHYEWTDAMDKHNHAKLKDAEQLRTDLTQLGITPEKTIICHCQSHHRSAHTCIMLNSLGYTKVKGYPGSWSDWGNDPTTPIES